MQPDREAVYQALLQLLQASSPITTAFKTISRRIKPIQDCSSSDAPYLFQVQNREESSPTKNVPAKRKFILDLVCYAFSDGTDGAVLSTAVNALTTAIEAALAPDAATAIQDLEQTVNSVVVVVSSVLIKGTILYFEDPLSRWAGAIVPIEMVATL